MQEFDVLIIGNGILGLSTAYFLVNEDPSARIGIIGPVGSEGAATFAAGAMLGCFGEVTQSTFQSNYSQEKLNIAFSATKLWPQWVNQLNDSLDKEDQIKINLGTFVLLNTKAGKRENKNFAAILHALNLYKEAHELVDASDIPGLDPIDDCRPLRAIYIPNEGHINPQKVVHALKIILKKLPNVALMEGSVEQIIITKNKLTGVKTKNQEIINASSIVLAAGAYSQKLINQIPEISERIPHIFAGNGCSLLLKQEEHTIRTVIRSPNRAGACGIHIMPREGDKHYLFMGSSNSVRLTPVTVPKVRDIYYLLERAIEQFNQNLHKAEVIKWNVGNRPITLDTFPLIGETSIPGLWFLTGTYRDGFHHSPILGSTLAKRFFNKIPTLFNNYFLPERKAIQLMTKEEAIEEFADQYMSAAYEHSIKMPKIGWDIVFREMWIERMTSVYKELGIEVGLSPDLLIMLEQERSLIPHFRKYCELFKASSTTSTSL